ncbi:msrB [Symbiodinium natans]|uniref:MsrB protein n=1 Tax=Symbiodinium natans TaxID=878477 RepID=A0A812U3R3_9DINO|nr:msrB [Symbiodinium natans]
MCSFWDGQVEPADVRRFCNGRLLRQMGEAAQEMAGEPLISGPAEDAIEAQSAAAGPNGLEAFLDHWNAGVYSCARCHKQLYPSSSKWRGPCAWPSFRAPVAAALRTRPVVGYGGYKCAVAELYCKGCNLFIGHCFQDAFELGDKGPESTGWRH